MNLSETQQVHAIYMFYVMDESLEKIADTLGCSVNDLFPWLTSIVTKIIVGLPRKYPELQKLAKLLDEIDNFQNKIAKVKSNNNAEIAELLRRARLALCHLSIEHETDKTFLQISDIQHRKAIGVIEEITKAPVYTIKGDPSSGVHLELVAAILKGVQFLTDESPTDTEDHYTEGVMADGAAILKDGVPLTITQVLDILNGRTRR